MNNLILFPFLFILGTSVGSFLNVLVDRLPKEQKITGRSRCDYCYHQLIWYDLIPIVSFFLLRGRCRYCGKKISWQYPIVEMTTGLSFLLISNIKYQISNIHIKNQIFSDFFPLVIYLGIISCLIVIFFQDLKYQIISDWIQLFFFIFTLIYHFATPQFPPTRCNLACYIAPLFAYFAAGIAICLPILFLHFVTAGRGMGFGDVKLSFTIGFFLGIKAGFLALYFAFVIGAVVGLFLILLGRKKLKSKIAFGPFLVFGVLIILFWQKEVFQLVNKIYGF